MLKNNYFERECDFLCNAVLNNDPLVDLYKKIFVLVPNNDNFPIYTGVKSLAEEKYNVTVSVTRGGKRLVINRLAVHKIRQMLQTVRRMHVLSRNVIEQPCYEQLSWIEKKPKDVVYRNST